MYDIYEVLDNRFYEKNKYFRHLRSLRLLFGEVKIEPQWRKPVYYLQLLLGIGYVRLTISGFKKLVGDFNIPNKSAEIV